MLLCGTSRFEKVYHPLSRPLFLAKSQGRPAVVILGVDVGSVPEQKTHYFYTALTPPELPQNQWRTSRPSSRRYFGR